MRRIFVKSSSRSKNQRCSRLVNYSCVLAFLTHFFIGFSPLHYAIASGNVDSVNLLLNVTEESVFKKEGGSPDVTPLHLAVDHIFITTVLAI